MVNSIFAVWGVSSKIGRAADHPLVKNPEGAAVALAPLDPAGNLQPTVAARAMVAAGLEAHPSRRATLPEETRRALAAYLDERAELLERAAAIAPAQAVDWQRKRTARLRALLGAGDDS